MAIKPGTEVAAGASAKHMQTTGGMPGLFLLKSRFCKYHALSGKPSRHKWLEFTASVVGDFQAVIFALDIDHLAHFVQTGAKPDANTIGQRLFVRTISFILIIGGKDGDLFVVISCVDDLSHRIAHPVSRFRSAEL